MVSGQWPISENAVHSLATDQWPLISFEFLLQLSHERFFLRGVFHVAVFAFGELAEKLFLMLGQFLRNLDQYLNDFVAVAIRANVRQALTLELEHLAVLCACRDVEMIVALEGRHFDGPAERGLGEAHGDLADQVVVVTREGLVGFHGDVTMQIAGRRAAFAGFALALDADGLSLMHAGRNLHGDDLLADLPA